MHADLHNHTRISDGAGDPGLAFETLRRAGLDVAALTDHVHFPDPVRAAFDPWSHPEPEARARYAGRPRGGMTPEGWRRSAELADAADEPGRFTAIRGFEWTEPWIGHVNVWFSPAFTPVMEVGRTQALLAWLAAQPEGLAGLNHPGREPGRFDGFAYSPAAGPRVVSMEIFNRYDDYLFEGHAAGAASPLVACLDAGYRPGLLGVTDEHEDDWGFHEGKGRAGVWVSELSRRGVAEALRARRFFATRSAGLRVDATVDGARMGSVLPPRDGPLRRLLLDVDGGPDWHGRPLEAQLLARGPSVPEVVEVVPFRAGEPLDVEVPAGPEDGDWLLVRVADPTRANATPGPEGHPANNFAVAYTSPWYRRPTV